MKKNFVKLADMANLGAIRRKIVNAFSEKGQEVADALKALIDELEAAEVEVDETALVEKIKEVVATAAPSEPVETAIAEAIAKRMQAITNTAKGKELDAKIKNQIASAILRASGKEEIENAVNKILVKNDISGLTFEDVVDYTVVENWGDLNPIFAQLHKTFYTKFFYTEEELKTATLIAKQWDKTGEAEKAIQKIVTTGKRIDTDYIYKRQQIAQSDLDEIEKAGEMTNFLRFINEELDRMIVNSIVMAILIGDTTNEMADRITTFETIGNKTVSDAFTTVLNPAGDDVTLVDFRKMADAVKNPNAKKKIAIVSNATLSQIAEFKYSGTGSVLYRSNEEVAKQIGVDEIIVCDLINPEDGIFGIVMLGDGYWYNEKNAIAVSYPKWEKNVINYQKERNIGGAIHDLFSTAILKANA